MIAPPLLSLPAVRRLQALAATLQNAVKPSPQQMRVIQILQHTVCVWVSVAGHLVLPIVFAEQLHPAAQKSSLQNVGQEQLC